MGIPGENLSKVQHYYKEAHPYVGQKVLVVGAGNSGVDVALECFRSGADVSMAIRYSQVKPTVKYWVKPDIENRIEKKEITAYFNSEVIEIRDDEVDLNTPNGPITIQNDFVFAMTGYRPNYALLDRLGIEYSADEACIPVYDEQHLETNRKGIYVAGVVCAGKKTSTLFIENSRVHAEQISYTYYALNGIKSCISILNPRYKKRASDPYHVATTRLPLLHSCPDGVQRELTVWDLPE